MITLKCPKLKDLKNIGILSRLESGVYSDNVLTIKVPNLLKNRDNYSKNLQVSCKKLTSKEEYE